MSDKDEWDDDDGFESIVSQMVEQSQECQRLIEQSQMPEIIAGSSQEKENHVRDRLEEGAVDCKPKPLVARMDNTSMKPTPEIKTEFKRPTAPKPKKKAGDIFETSEMEIDKHLRTAISVSKSDSQSPGSFRGDRVRSKTGRTKKPRQNTLLKPDTSRSRRASTSTDAPLDFTFSQIPQRRTPPPESRKPPPPSPKRKELIARIKADNDGKSSRKDKRTSKEKHGEQISSSIKEMKCDRRNHRFNLIMNHDIHNTFAPPSGIAKAGWELGPDITATKDFVQTLRDEKKLERLHQETKVIAVGAVKEENCQFQRIQLGPVLPVLKRYKKVYRTRNGKKRREKIKINPTVEKRTRNKISREKALRKYRECHKRFLEELKSGVSKSPNEISLLEKVQRPLIGNLYSGKVLPKFKEDTIENAIQGMRLNAEDPYPKKRFNIKNPAANGARVPKLGDEKMCVRRRVIRVCKFREPCWQLPTNHIRDVETIIRTIHTYNEIFELEVPKLFQAEYTATILNEGKEVITCPWKYTGIHRFLDTINTAIRLMHTRSGTRLELIGNSSNCRVIMRYISSISPRVIGPFLSQPDLIEYLKVGFLFCEVLLKSTRQFCYRVRKKRKTTGHVGKQLLDSIYDMVRYFLSYCIFHKDNNLLEALRVPLISLYQTFDRCLYGRMAFRCYQKHKKCMKRVKIVNGKRIYPKVLRKRISHDKVLKDKDGLGRNQTRYGLLALIDNILDLRAIPYNTRMETNTFIWHNWYSNLSLEAQFQILGRFNGRDERQYRRGKKRRASGQMEALRKFEVFVTALELRMDEMEETFENYRRLVEMLSLLAVPFLSSNFGRILTQRTRRDRESKDEHTNIAKRVYLISKLFWRRIRDVKNRIQNVRPFSPREERQLEALNCFFRLLSIAGYANPGYCLPDLSAKEEQDERPREFEGIEGTRTEPMEIGEEPMG